MVFSFFSYRKITNYFFIDQIIFVKNFLKINMQPHSKEMSRLRYATLNMTALRGVGKECRGEAERSRGILLLIEKTHT
jgi:hypothetical protein